jgi:hypothetical protein
MYYPEDRDYLKLYRKVVVSLAHKNNLTRAQVEFLIFIYKKQYITWKEAFCNFYASNTFLDRKVPDLIKKGFLIVYRHESKRLGQARQYAISQNGRLLVSRVYRMLEGLEDIPNIYDREV